MPDLKPGYNLIRRRGEAVIRGVRKREPGIAR
jgi:hypothetical protein